MEIEPNTKPLKLDLGAGQSPREGFEGFMRELADARDHLSARRILVRDFDGEEWEAKLIEAEARAGELRHAEGSAEQRIADGQNLDGLHDL